MSRTIARMDADELLTNADQVIDAASAKLSALCHGERWRMCVPVQDDDSDVPLGAVIRLARLAVDQLRAAPSPVAITEAREIIEHATAIVRLVPILAGSTQPVRPTPSGQR